MRELTKQDYVSQLGMYRKIQDRLLLLGNNVVLNMNIILYYQNSRKEQEYYYKEIQYLSKDNTIAKKMVRQFDAFLSLDNIKPVGDYREYIVIRGKDLELMRMMLLPKFEAIIQNFDQIYQTRNGKMYVSDKIKPFQLDLGQKCIVCVPGIHKTYSETVEPCIDMYLNGRESNSAYMNFNQVYGLMYIIRTFDLYMYASTMLAFLSRPPMGTNMIDMGGTNAHLLQEPVEPVHTPKRFIGGARKESYFDKKRK